MVELKTVQAITRNHYATLNSYLKATGLTNALLLNFAEAKLVIKRLYEQKPQRSPRPR